MKYLLLGGSGFIGSHLAKRLAFKDQVVIMGYQAHFETDDPSIEYRQIDFTKCKDFTEYIKDVDVIVHMVSTITPSEDTDKINLEIENNVFPTITLFENASKLKKEVVFISSGGAVYGEGKNKNKETDSTNPICNYGIIKLTIEKYLMLYHQYYGLKYKIIRPSNPYSGTVYHNKKQGIIPVIIDSIRNDLLMTIYGNGQIRDYIYIDDLVEGINAVLEYSGDEHVFNIGTGEGYTIEELIEAIEKKMNKKLQVEWRPIRKCDVLKNVLDISLIKKEIGWEPKVTLGDGIDKILGEQQCLN